MIFTTKAEYGVRLLVQLGVQSSGSPVSLKAIAEAESLPLAYLERIAALLKKAGMVEATRGAHGGYLLARPAAEITMDQVVGGDPRAGERARGAVQAIHVIAESRGVERPAHRAGRYPGELLPRW